ncbi:hypothetical protein F3Y22_tig00110384pilonHSYRG00700 [Hibiscus syriacus]|uniref:Uncharacterized protein n=1 Tax=Hibiscus syriacus TaxID=106335 RepID=A0A6A3AUJ0_HIBSY|nr:hypothetical protein F3Y22_tig00110384pilonHSYRG00700 [Hibiscus syriacus]
MALPKRNRGAQGLRQVKCAGQQLSPRARRRPQSSHPKLAVDPPHFHRPSSSPPRLHPFLLSVAAASPSLHLRLHLSAIPNPPTPKFSVSPLLFFTQTLTFLGSLPTKTKKKGSVIGSSLATAIAVAYFLFYRKGFMFDFRSPLNAFNVVFSSREVKIDQTEARDYLESDEPAAEAIPDYVPLAVPEIVPSAPSHKRELIVVPVAVDSAQQEALLVLKKLRVCFLKLLLYEIISDPFQMNCI